MRAVDGAYWRIIPEELSCSAVASGSDEWAELRRSGAFEQDWRMERFVARARVVLGPLGPGRCYSLKIPATVGGTYADGNLGTTSLEELLAFAGDVARQIRDLPDGAHVRFDVVS